MVLSSWDGIQMFRIKHKCWKWIGKWQEVDGEDRFVTAEGAC